MTFDYSKRRAIVPTLFALSTSLMAADIVVEAQPLPIIEPGYLGAQEQASHHPGGASVVSSEVYLTGRSSTYKDALSYAPGVFIQSRFGADESRLSIRGSGLQRNFHMRGILLLADGIPISTADGGGDFQSISPVLTDYIEVYRGAQGQALGASTLGGAINFVSPTGRTASPLEVSCEAGSFGYGRATVTSGGTVGAWDVWGGATISESAGYRDHSRSEDGRFMGNVGYQFNEHWANRLTLGYSNSDSELPGALTRAQMEDDPQQTNPGNIINDAQRNYPLFRVGDKIAWTTSTQHVELAAGYSHKELYHPLFFFFAGPNPVGPVIDQESNDGVLSLGYTGQFSNHRMTSLIVTSAGLTHAERYFNNKGDEGALLSEAYQRSTNATLDIADECEVVPGTFPSFGLQFARSTRELDDQFEINGVDYSDEFSFSQVNPRIGVRQHITKEAQIFGNVSRSCDPPSFGELVPIGTTPGLLDLEAQSAWTAEIGSRAGYEQASWDLSLYYAWITNELLSYQTAPNQNTTLNAEDTRHAGVELGSTVVPLQNLFMQDQVMVRMNYLFNWFRFEDDSVYGNNQIAGVPPQVITAEAMYEFLRGWYAGPTVEAASAGYVDLANTTQAPGWATFGVKAGYRAKNGFSGWVEARNLGNVTYASSYHVVTQANPNSAVYLPGDGRAYYAGAGWRW